MILMFLGAWPLSEQTTLRNEVLEKQILPKNPPIVKALEKYVAEVRKSELVRKLEGSFDCGRSTVVTDTHINAKIAIEDLERGNYRSFYLEYALKNVVDEIGDCVLDPGTREYVKKSKKRKQYKRWTGKV